VIQGERPLAKDNRTIGRFHLDGIPPAPRGVPQIEVTFDIDANGILNVSAKDKGTGKEQKIRIEASSGLTDAEIEKMRQEAKANEASDKAEKEKIEKLNQADSLIFQTEKQLKEYGDKLSAGNKSAIESALTTLKNAHSIRDVAAVDTALEALNKAWEAASQEMYAAAGGAQGQPGDAGQGQPNNQQAEADVTDVDYEEVGGENKK
jgi:molecular chaperone DnaK